jgi:hypothetical protein
MNQLDFLNDPRTIQQVDPTPLEVAINRQPMRRFIVETEFHGGIWENVWAEDGKPDTFATLNDAVQEIRDHIIDSISAVEAGDMKDSPDPSNFRIVEESQREIGQEVMAVYYFTGRPWMYEAAL